MVKNILIVDDFEEVRSLIREILDLHPGFRVIGEAPDGVTAVRKCEELKPYLVLLDITMPWMNGFDAGREILRVAPATNLIFVTDHNSSAMAAKAFALGARGYVLKAHLSTELLPALEAVVCGETFVSRYLG
jgi:DNA-binding NarL/FixJ family response regulator